LICFFYMQIAKFFWEIFKKIFTVPQFICIWKLELANHRKGSFRDHVKSDPELKLIAMFMRIDGLCKKKSVIGRIGCGHGHVNCSQAKSWPSTCGLCSRSRAVSKNFTAEQMENFCDPTFRKCPHTAHF
jgi:hypothetical protein